jgi:hypothetical protein
VGEPDPNSANGSGYSLPYEGYIADNVAVNMGVSLGLTRPYSYVAALDEAKDFTDPSEVDSSEKMTPSKTASMEADPNYAPILTMPQDWHVKALPSVKLQDNVDAQQHSFKQVKLKWGVPTAELTAATDPNGPFHFQILPFEKGGGLFTWDSGKTIPETTAVPQMYPLAIFGKLQDDRNADPEDLNAQGDQFNPPVIIQGITVFQDSLFTTAGLAGTVPPKQPSGMDARVDHIRVLIRPSVICFNATSIQSGGLLVTPFQQGEDPGSTDPMTGNPRQKDIVDINAVIASANSGPQKLIRDYRFACLPKGRFSVNLVYPTSQVWSVPNEAGSCAPPEGTTDFMNLTCSSKPRPVLYSQGTRAVIEITDAQDPNNCKGAMAVPDECLPCCQRQNMSKFAECNGAQCQ